MIEEDLLVNIVRNRTDALLANDKIGTREKIIRLDELRLLFESISFRNELIKLQDELSES